MVLRFAVVRSQDGWILRDVLRAHSVSAGLLTALKQSDGIRVNEAPMRANERVHSGDWIELTLPAEPATDVAPQAIPVSVAYESVHVVVLDKPAGMAVHPTLGYRDGTLANAWMGELVRRGETGIFRPVNRLDCNTSGLVLCAKNAWAASALAKSARKVYLALVEGEMPLGPDAIDAPIARCEDSIIRRRVDGSGKPSRTEYEVLGSAGGLSLVACIPITGRTHQIRVHFSWAGHPLAGDDLYGGARTLIARHALHCAQITFPDPESGTLRCVARDLPDDMKRVCQTLKMDVKEFSHF